MTTTATPTHEHGSGIRRLAARRPATAFVTVVLSIGLPLLTLAAVINVPREPFLLLTTYVGLTGAALVITRWLGGPGAIRELLRRLLHWRFGTGRWLTIVLALPALTLGVAAATGTIQTPPDGWAAEAGVYLLSVFVFGTLLLNAWEELGWTGFLQARLMRRHGLLVGALITAVPFAALHLPLAFTSGWTWSSAGLAIAVVIVFAPFFRYLLGMLYLDSGGSLLAVSLMHAAFNAAGSLEAVRGDWQYIPAMIALTVAMALWRRRHAIPTSTTK